MEVSDIVSSATKAANGVDFYTSRATCLLIIAFFSQLTYERVVTIAPTTLDIPIAFVVVFLARVLPWSTGNIAKVGSNLRFDLVECCCGEQDDDVVVHLRVDRVECCCGEQEDDDVVVHLGKCWRSLILRFVDCCCYGEFQLVRSSPDEVVCCVAIELVT